MIDIDTSLDAVDVAARTWMTALAMFAAAPTGQGRARWTMRWKPALNAFAITFADRFPAAETY
jgi:hypothetical protein